METLVNSFLLVFAGEMGDKTQLLALILNAKFKKPWTILVAIFIATILNHALASWAGAWISNLFSPTTLSWVLAITFFAFSIWVLIPDKEEDLRSTNRMGAFATTLIVFFLAEMGDKTQLATIALGAKYDSTLLVTIGTTLGMIASNALAIFLGEKLLQKIPMHWFRRFASSLFAFFGALILFSIFY